MTIRTLIRSGSITTLLLALAACGGDSGSSTGQLTIGLTDGPVENAHKVTIAFRGIELKPTGDGEPVDSAPFDVSTCDSFEPSTGTCSIDLLNLQGNERSVVFSEPLTPGSYKLRLLVDADLDEMDSYITLKDNTECPLYIPSGAQNGLKLVDSLIVTANGTSDYTVDFDARKSVTAPPGQAGDNQDCAQNYLLKPTLRVVDTTQVGTISGTVSAQLLADAECSTSEGTGQYENVAVYVFDDAEGTAVADDIDLDDDGYPDPITTATVKYDSDADAYVYEVGFLLPQDYRLALTCSADLDMADANEFDAASTGTQGFSFIAEGTASVETGVTAIVDFAPTQP